MSKIETQKEMNFLSLVGDFFFASSQATPLLRDMPHDSQIALSGRYHIEFQLMN